MIFILIKPVLFLTLSVFILTFLLLLAEKKILNYGPCTIDINKGSKNFMLEGGRSLLSSLISKDIFIPSACGGRGTCGYCRVKVLKGGGFLGPVEEGVLESKEIMSGVRLSCQVKIRKNIDILIPEELFQARRYKAVLFKKKFLTYDILSLSLKIIEPKDMFFKAGQYIQLESGEYKGRESVMRAYSIASVPSNRNEINLMIRKVPDGICTTWVFNYFNQGDEVFFSGPYGNFILSDKNAPIIFIAGGSGMAPIWSILQYMIENKINRKVNYFFGALSTDDLFYLKRFEDLSSRFEWFNFVPALSNEPEDSSWVGERGLITNIVRKYIVDASDYEAYLCGSPGMINACLATLIEIGILEKNIFYDKF